MLIFKYKILGLICSLMHKKKKKLGSKCKQLLVKCIHEKVIQVYCNKLRH